MLEDVLTEERATGKKKIAQYNSLRDVIQIITARLTGFTSIERLGKIRHRKFPCSVKRVYRIREMETIYSRIQQGLSYCALKLFSQHLITSQT
jgi:hypothetical protein